MKERKISVTIKDIITEPPSVKELQKMLDFQNGNITKILNTSGILYREMQLSQKVKEMPVSEILALLSSNGMLIKRPFLLAKDFGITGFNDKLWNDSIH